MNEASEADRRIRDDDAILPLFDDLDSDASVRDRIALRYQPLAEYLARRFEGRGETLEDLVQVANVGLLKAIDRFDPHRGTQFSTYAAATMLGELKRHLRDKGWALRVPRRLQELSLRIGQAVSELTQSLGRSPTIPELARWLETTEDEIVEAMEAAHAYSTSSLDTDAHASAVSEGLQHTEAPLEVVEGWTTIAPAIKELSPRERTVLYLRFFRGWTQSEIAEDIGVSQMHVSRILAQSLEHLRRSAEG